MAIVGETFALTNVGTATTTWNATKPSGLVAGDVMVAAFSVDASGVSITPPSGWQTMLAPLGTGSQSITIAAYAKVADANDAAASTFSFTLTSSKGNVGIRRYSGVDNTTPIDTTSSSNIFVGAASSITVTGITVSAGAMLVGGISVNVNNSSATPPSGMTEVYDSGTSQHIEFAEVVQASAGASGDKTWGGFTTSSSQSVGAWLGALRAAAGGGTTRITVTRAASWNVRQRIAATRSVTWNIRQRLTASRAASWNLRSRVTATRAASWSIKQRIAATRQTTWNVRGRVTATRQAVWNTRSRLAATRAASWAVRSRVTTTRDISWNVRQRVTASRVALWDVLGALTRITVTRAASWDVRSRVTASRSANWHLRQRLQVARPMSWHVRARLAVTRAASWSVRSRLAVTRAVRWSVRSRIVATRPALWEVLSEIPPLAITLKATVSRGWSGTIDREWAAQVARAWSATIDREWAAQVARTWKAKVSR